MNDLYIKTLLDIAYDFVHILTLLALILSLATGLMLIFKPEHVIQWNTRFQKTYSMRRQTRSLEQPHDIDRLFYRHHLIVGSTITIISAYIFYYFSMVFTINMFAIIFSGYSTAILALLADWLRILMLVVSTLTLIIGITILLRPSGLKSFESWANRWISTRQATRPLTQNYQKLDQLLLASPRVLGITLVLLSLYSVISLILLYN
jgi:hypothetical protein